MKELIRPLVVLALTLLGGGSVLYFLKHSNSMKTKEDKKGDKTVQEFVNVKDIKDKFLYTRDNKMIGYIKVNPIDINLLSKREQRLLCKTLTAEMSGLQRQIKFIAVSRPVDISPLINEYQEILLNTTNQKQKELLRKEIFAVTNYAMGGEVVERQFYIMLWQDYDDDGEKELLKLERDLVSKFTACRIESEIIKEKEIYRLCNLINNPAYVNSEDETFEASIPLLFQ